MHLLDTPLFISATYNMSECQVRRIRWVYRTTQSLQSAGDEHRTVVVLASKGVSTLKCPVDIRCHLSEEGCVVAGIEIVKDFRDVTFVGVYGDLLRRCALGAS